MQDLANRHTAKGGLVQGLREGIDHRRRKYGGVNDYAFDIKQKITKQWEAKYDMQLALKLKKENRKREAAMEMKQKKKSGAERKDREEKKEQQAKEDVTMENTPPTHSILIS